MSQMPEFSSTSHPGSTLFLPIPLLTFSPIHHFPLFFYLRHHSQRGLFSWLAESITVFFPKRLEDIWMGTCLLKNALVISCDLKDRCFTGDVLIEGDKIKEVGRDFAPKAADRVIELDGCSLLPGFIDLHIHLTFRRTIGPTRRNCQRWWRP